MTKDLRGTSLSRHARDKIVTARTAARHARAAQRRGASVVFTNGCYDLLHVGHLRGFEAARRLGDVLIVGVNLDASVRDLKGPERPIQSERDRLELVAGLAAVDWVVGFSAPTPRALIETIGPDVLAKGGDWALDEIVGREAVERRGGRVVRLPLTAGRSTSAIIDRIRQKAPRRKR